MDIFSVFLFYSLACMYIYIYIILIYVLILMISLIKTCNYNVPLLFQLLSLETSSHQTKQNILQRRVQMLHYPVVIPLQMIYTGIVNIQDLLLNFSCSSLMVQQTPKSLL